MNVPSQDTTETPAATGPTFGEAMRVWAKIGLLGFGGPAGQIALMHRELVEKRRWLDERGFLHALNFCMLLPGPEAQQLAVHTGWLMHRTRGGLIAGLLFVLPGAFLMWLISCLYVLYGQMPLLEASFYGLKAAVMALVAAALWKIGGKILKNPWMWLIAMASFVAIFGFRAPFPLVVLSALGFGLWFGKHFPAPTGHGGIGDANFRGSANREIPAPTMLGTLATVFLWLCIWLLPPLVCLWFLGPHHVLSSQGLFFSKAALVTFGGAYAVLPYVAQQAVEAHGWLNSGQMMDGLGLAETTPGPLILVLQFVGFLGGWNQPGELSPLLMASLASVMTTWCTFMPGFLFIFAGAPFVSRGQGSQRFQNALAAVTAAVVGVILNLAVWFAWEMVVPQPGRVDLIPVLLAALLFFLMKFKRLGVAAIIGLGAGAGLALHLTGIA